MLSENNRGHAGVPGILPPPRTARGESLQNRIGPGRLHAPAETSSAKQPGPLPAPVFSLVCIQSRWAGWRELNPRHLDYQSSALPLSYIPVGMTGLEPAACRHATCCSHQLSYILRDTRFLRNLGSSTTHARRITGAEACRPGIHEPAPLGRLPNAPKEYIGVPVLAYVRVIGFIGLVLFDCGSTQDKTTAVKLCQAPVRAVLPNGSQTKILLAMISSAGSSFLSS